MKLLIIGASRGIGKALLEEALKEDLQVRVLARDPEKIEATNDALEIVRGDVRDLDDVSNGLQGMDVVCSCIGVPITFKPVDLFAVAARNLVQAVEREPGQKLIAVTGIGAGDSKGHGGFLYDRIFKPLFLRTIYDDKDREEEIIMASTTDWLIVRPAGLTNGPRTGKYKVLNDLEGNVATRISRRDVADFILSEMVKPTQFGKTPLITY
ncbi:MAG: SDR family oxidoreductase [Desulfobulbaceae bacterium]|nr:SDR family oxidoreductase [Desulfofustis sp.]RZW20537.1 MAG: SDR family oxidoreductase [Desulfobulbaceae bacterium]